VLVANEQDKSVYYYEEGMAAARASSAITATFRAPSCRWIAPPRAFAAGFTTVLRLGEAGSCEVVFALSSPRIVKGFPLDVAPNDELERQRKTGKRVALAGMENHVESGPAGGIDFKVADELSKQPRSKLRL
jgi:hypothetical protein